MAVEFIAPDFVDDNSPEEIQERMMEALPEGIDDMPGGFPYDFTMPTAIEKSQFIELHIVRTLQLMFSQFAWDEWLDLHAAAAGIERRPAGYATGIVTVYGELDTVIPAGTVFATAATDSTPSLEFSADEQYSIPDTGSVDVSVTAVEAGTESNVNANTVVFLMTGISGVSGVTNLSDITGGTDIEDDESLRERIALENAAEGATFIANDSDYIRWAKEVTGIGDCIVVPAWDGPGTVKLVLVDSNGRPANASLVQAVYDHIVSPNDRSSRLLPTGTASLTVAAATTRYISYTCTGLQYDDTTDLDQIAADFSEMVLEEYAEAKDTGVVVYNQVRALITAIPGVSDFSSFKMDGAEDNIILGTEEYASTDEVEFS